MLHSIIPAIKYDNCRQAIDWLCEVFDFSLEFLVDGDGEMVKHAQLMKGSSMIMVGSSDHSEFGSLNVSPRLIGNRVTTSLYVVLDNITPHYHRVCRAGADIVIELTEEDYGGASYTCRDIEGHIWTFGTYNPFS